MRGQLQAALAGFEQALEVTRLSRGTDNDDYANLLELKANALSLAGLTARASATYAESEKIIRRVNAADPSENLAQVFREVLIDYAGFLLRDDAIERRPRELARASSLLQGSSHDGRHRC